MGGPVIPGYWSAERLENNYAAMSRDEQVRLDAQLSAQRREVDRLYPLPKPKPWFKESK